MKEPESPETELVTPRLNEHNQLFSMYESLFPSLGLWKGVNAWHIDKKKTVICLFFFCGGQARVQVIQNVSF